MIKRLMGCVREYKKQALMTPVYVALEVAMDIILPLLMARMIDLGIGNGDMAVIGKTGLALLVCAGLALVFGVLSGRSAAAAAAGFSKNVRHDLYYNLQDFSFQNIDKFTTSSLITRMTTDVTHLQHAFQMGMRIAVRAPLMLVFALIMSFTINRSLSLVFFAVVPVLGLGIFLIMSKAHPVFEQVFKKYDQMNNVVQENLRGIRVVKN